MLLLLSIYIKNKLINKYVFLSIYIYIIFSYICISVSVSLKMYLGSNNLSSIKSGAMKSIQHTKISAEVNLNFNKINIYIKNTLKSL